MTRLTKYTREKMATLLLKHRFNGQGEGLSARCAKLFVEVYDDQYDAATVQLMQKLLKRHSTAFPFSKSLVVNTRGRRFMVGEVSIGDGSVRYSAKVDPLPTFRDDRIYQYLDGLIADRLCDFSNDQIAFQREINSARTEINAVLASFTTEKQLAEQWPEIMPVVQPVLGVTLPGTNSPAVQIARINSVFGLPPAGEAGQ